MFYSYVILALGMGLGRFIYTPLCSQMLNIESITLVELSWIASSNYLGYLIGSILIIRYSINSSEKYLYFLRVFALLMTFSLFLMSYFDGFIAMCIIRFISGACSSGMMIFGSLYILSCCDHRFVSAFYGGVGLGVLLGNEWVLIADKYQMNIFQIWFSVGVISLVLSVFLCSTNLKINKKLTDTTFTSKINNDHYDLNYFSWKKLLLINGLAGFGYIINATYLPIIASDITNNFFIYKHLWSFTGLAIIPSCFLWNSICHKLGFSLSLSLNLFIQSIGITLSIFSSSSLALCISALILGATFMGFVTIALPFARQLNYPKNINMIALMTSTYGTGQILGPVATALLTTQFGSFKFAAFSAIASLVIAAILCLHVMTVFTQRVITD